MRLVIQERPHLTDISADVDHAIEVRSLGKTFGRIEAVRDLTFQVPWGTVTGILGLEGAGKTTTIRLVLGLTAPGAGSATIAGLPFHLHRRPALLVGAALGADTFQSSWSPRKQLRLMTAAARLDRARIDEVLERTELGAVADRRIGTLDADARQRLAIAIALLGRPRVLVLDEPASGLDEAGRAWLRSLLRDFAADGGAVLMTGRTIGDLVGSADEVLMLERGREIARGALDDGSGFILPEARELTRAVS